MYIIQANNLHIFYSFTINYRKFETNIILSNILLQSLFIVSSHNPPIISVILKDNSLFAINLCLFVYSRCLMSVLMHTHVHNRPVWLKMPNFQVQDDKFYCLVKFYQYVVVTHGVNTTLRILLLVTISHVYIFSETMNTSI